MSDLSVMGDDVSVPFIASDTNSRTSSITSSDSSTSEEELLDLAQNFLLYMAMVIILIMVTKIYWPHLLIRNSDETTYTPTDTDTVTNNDTDNNTNNKKSTRRTSKSILRENTTHAEASPPLQDETKDVVLKKLMICFVGLNISFVMWGILQERMLTRRYPRYTGEFFTYSYFLVFSNRLWGLAMSLCLWLYLKPVRSKGVLIYEYSFPSISNMLSSWCQYEALKYVSFPAQTLFKSFKLAPIMLMGKLLQNKNYPNSDYFVALVVGIGIALFMSGSENVDFTTSILSYGETENNTNTGIMLLFLFLLFDSFTGQWQSRMFTRHPNMSVLEMLIANNLFSCVLSLITLLHSDQLAPALDFVWRHNEIHLHFFLFSVCSTVGQLLIFYTIKNFGAVVFAIIMTCRILISIVVSCILYDHSMTATGFMGLLLVMIGVGYRTKLKAEGKQLVKWVGIDDDEEEDMVHEWHEHLDL